MSTGCAVAENETFAEVRPCDVSISTGHFRIDMTPRLLMITQRSLSVLLIVQSGADSAMRS